MSVSSTNIIWKKNNLLSNFELIVYPSKLFKPCDEYKRNYFSVLNYSQTNLQTRKKDSRTYKIRFGDTIEYRAFKIYK